MEHELIIVLLMPFALLGTMKLAEMGWELIDWIRARKDKDEPPEQIRA